MNITTLNNKGQITIPSSLRKKLGLKAGVKMKIFSSGKNQELYLTPTTSVHDLAGYLPRPKRAFSIDEINAGIEEGAVADNPELQ